MSGLHARRTGGVFFFRSIITGEMFIKYLFVKLIICSAGTSSSVVPVDLVPTIWARLNLLCFGADSIIDWEYSSNLSLSLMSISSYVEYETGNINTYFISYGTIA